MSSIYSWSLTASDNDDADNTVNWLENQLPNTVNNSARAMMARVAELLKDLGGSTTASGTANAIVLTAASPFDTLTDGLIVSFKAALSNTSATVTIAVNGLASKPIRKQGLGGDIALSPNDLRQNGIYRLIYSTAANSGTGAWMLQGAGTGAFEAGTRLLFQQTAAPTGWTKDTSQNDKALRVVSGTTGTGGSTPFSTTFSSRGTGFTALLEANLPAHTHTVSGTTGVQNANHTHTFTGSGVSGAAGSHVVTGLPSGGSGGFGSPGVATGAAGSFAVGDHTHPVTVTGTTNTESAAHAHTFSATSSSTGSGAGHNHLMDMTVQYVDVIIATKD